MGIDGKMIDKLGLRLKAQKVANIILSLASTVPDLYQLPDTVTVHLSTKMSYLDHQLWKKQCIFLVPQL